MEVYHYAQRGEDVEERFPVPQVRDKIVVLKETLAREWEKDEVESSAWNFVGEEQFGDGVWMFVVYDHSMSLSDSTSTTFVLELGPRATVWVVHRRWQPRFMEEGCDHETIDILMYAE